MLHAPAAENKTNENAAKSASNRTRTNLPPSRELAPRSVSPPLRPSQMPLLQRKPAVSLPGDAFEREADNAADHVMRMAEPPAFHAPPAMIQRQCAMCSEEEKKRIQRKSAPAAETGDSLDTEAAVRTARQGGTPLPETVRAYFEPRFGQDFSGVRVHTGSAASEGANAVQVRAYTVGSHIVFGPGEYAPHEAGGQRLLAHELAHVVQQGASVRRDSFGMAQASGPAAAAAHPALAAPPVQRQAFLLSPMPPNSIARAPRLGGDGSQQELCYDLGPILSRIDPAASNLFGTAAEIPIFLDYCTKMNCNYFTSAIFQGVNPSDDFFDNNNTTEYINFIEQHNPRLTTGQKVAMRGLSKNLRRPDILSHKRSRREFYEVKPNTVTGRSAGREKIGDLVSFYNAFSLPYIAGTAYKPRSEIILAEVFIGRVKVEIFLRLDMPTSGLIVYDLCIRGPLKDLLEDVIKEEVLRRLLQAAGRRLKIPEDYPLPPPVPVRIPSPAPIPKPVYEPGEGAGSYSDEVYEAYGGKPDKRNHALSLAGYAGSGDGGP